ncbi:alpha/beta fold hydrolase [Acinetobacter ursingii]|uniref:alpha/beta fold hydrolase n=1 Tax=Acinetobacter ursingii TaxID=108980 RepID=UPI001DB85584|nr:alpha/beta hydrolase [Acinetobacter ursingii]MCU4358042.1 alpha/beta hydrolase [Acinetobacter ursingii]MEC8057758.1 alpha/beta hydrolase [Pseudomonadota bacterium]NOZ97068.1 alpha/beta hydrolase [Gammaproteobacteria bacterium]
MKRTFSNLCLALSLSLGTTAIITHSNTAIAASNINIQNVLQQERTWAGLQTKKLKVGDIEWVYSEGGQSSKPTIILIHGLAGSRDNWNRVARYLTPNYHVIIPDLPAHGDTKVADDFDLSIPNLTEKLRRFAEAGHFEKAINIAGHSMGGAIALLYTAQYPTETKSLLLVDSAGVFKTANTPYLKNPTLLNELVVKKAGDFDKLFQLATATPPFIPTELKTEQEKLMISQSKSTQRMVDQLVAMSKVYTPETFAIAAKSIDVPTYIVWGDKDKIINVEAAQELKESLKNAEPPLILKDVGHMPIMEADQIVAQQYLIFLNKHK